MQSTHAGDGNLFERSSVCLAPMAGYTDAPFRLLCFQFGADFAVSEMISADGLVRNFGKAALLMGRIEGEGPVGVQLFGSDPDTIADAACLIERSGPAFIDLNFGCPVRKVVRRNGGAAVMRDLRLMERICSKVTSRVELPVTAKIRSGWNRCEENYREAGKILQDCGIAAVTIHPRYKAQGFGGCANWEHVAALKRSLSIPVIASGDVASADDYEALRARTGCDVVMIGRGALGNPWIFAAIRDRLQGKNQFVTGLEQRLAILRRHVTTAVAWKGERSGILEMRKHYRWYVKGLPAAREARHRLATAGSIDEVMRIIGDLGEECGRTWKKPA